MSAKSIVSARLMTGTTRPRLPSFRWTSTARPSAMPSGASRYGVPPLGQGLSHHWMLLGGLHQGERDQMRERDLPRLAGRLHGLISPRRLASSVPTGSTRKVVAVGHRQAFVHVGEELGGGALDGGGAGRQGGDGRRLGRGRGRRRVGPGSPGGRRDGAVAVGGFPDDPALEQAAPLGTDGGGIPEELFVHDLREARVGRLEHVRIDGRPPPRLMYARTGRRRDRGPWNGMPKIMPG